MFRLTLASLLAKKRRLLSTALSVVIGVAFLTGTMVFTDTIGQTFDDLFADLYDEVDSYVRNESSVDLAEAGSQRGRIPGSTVAQVAAVPGVADAQGFITGYAQIVGADGDALGDPGRGAPTLGMSDLAGPLSPWQLVEGARPGPGELMIDRGSAEKGELALGDEVTVLTQTGPHTFTLVGTVRFGSVDSPGGASVAVFDLTTAQAVMLGGTDELDAVLLDAAPGVTETQLSDQVADVVPPGIEVLTGTELTVETQNEMRDAFSFFDTFLMVFAVIGLFVACFTIYNTFQIVVSQRIGEMALLRAIGATRRQVLTAQLLEAVVVGVVASGIGLVAGVAVAGGLKVLMEGVGLDIPAGDTVFATRTAVMALATGLGVTVASAVFPSIRASRTPPLAAIRDVAGTSGRGSGRWALIQGIALVTAGVAAFVAGLSGAGVLWVGLGALATFIGVFSLGPLFARPAARLLGAPAATVFGVVGDLARENAMRNAKRTARTGGALMVGVALVASITIIAATAKDWARDMFDRQFMGDDVVNSEAFGFGGLSPELAGRLAGLPEVAVATGIRTGAARDVDGGGDVGYMAIDPTTAGGVFDLDFVDGSAAALTDTGILVDDDEAADRGLRMGDTLTFAFLDGGPRALTVEGIYREDDLAGPFVVSHALHESTGVDQFDIAVYLVRADGISGESARAAIEGVAGDYPNAKVQSRAEYIDDQASEVDQIVNLMYGLLSLAILIALLSIGNSISLSIHERTRELGLLRAVGTTRHQTAATVRGEAGIVALFGTAVGVLVGVCFGWGIAVTLRDDGLGAAAIPVPALVLIATVSVAGGILASLRPAWRAAHLDVLRAIASH